MGPVPSRKQVDPEYLVVDDTDGRVLAELSTAEEALQLLAELDPRQGISVVKLDSYDGGFVHYDSRVAVRPLFPNRPSLRQHPAF